MEVTTNRAEKGLIVSVKGRIDGVTTTDFEKTISDLIDQGETTLIIDFGELVYITSAGLRSILTIAKKLKQKNGTLIVAALRDVVKNVFEISGFTAIISTCESVESAIEQL